MVPGTYNGPTDDGPVSEMSFVAASTASGTSISIPAAAQAGDLAVLHDYAATAGTGTQADVVPSGWTGIVTSAFNDGSFNRRQRHSYKVLTPADIFAGSVSGMVGGAAVEKMMLAYRPVGAIETVTIPTWGAESTAGNPSSQNVSAAAQAAPLIVMGAAFSFSGTAAFSTASPAFGATQASASTLLVGYKIYNASPADHTIDMADLGFDNALASGYIRLS